MTTGLVTDQLGIEVTITPSVPAAARFAGALEVGLRRNPNRAQLLVSHLLGKHIPVPVCTVLAAARTLGSMVRPACAGQTPVVIGFAETATGLGHGVAAVSAVDGGPAPYLHTTRRAVPEGARVLRFTEDHSHAVDQSLVVLDDAGLRGDHPIVLVDDEFTTGQTALNAIRVLHAAWPRPVYALASLIDCRDKEQRAEAERAVGALGARLMTVSLLDGRVTLPPGVHDAALAFIAALPDSLDGGEQARAPVTWLEFPLPERVPSTAMTGWWPAQERAARAAMRRAAAALRLTGDGRTLVLGDEELMYLPQLLAAALGDEVRTSTTTRTPAVTIDRPGYPLRTALAFGSTDDGVRPAYAYNVAPSLAAERGNAPGFEHVVLVTDAERGPRTSGLVDQLAACAGSVHVVTLCPGGGAAAGERDAAQ